MIDAVDPDLTASAGIIRIAVAMIVIHAQTKDQAVAAFESPRERFAAEQGGNGIAGLFDGEYEVFRNGIDTQQSVTG